MKEIEVLIIGSMVHSSDYLTKVSPHLTKELFQHEDCRSIYSHFSEFFNEYKVVPTKESIQIELEQATGHDQDTINSGQAILEKIYSESFKAAIAKQEQKWLLEKTKTYLTDRAVYLAIMESLTILDKSGKSKKQPDVIPDMMRKALSINFDDEVGHNYLDDALLRFEQYHTSESKVPFSLTMLNKVTGGGLPDGSLGIVCAATGQGKSLFLTDQSAHWLKRGLDVLYISLEMSEVKIAERIDAKLFDLDIQNVSKMSEESFSKKIESIKKSTKGKLIIKQYAPGTFHANHLRALLIELKQKSGFHPDMIVVDYLGIMASYRIKSDMGSYTYLKFVAEELRGVAVENKCVTMSAMQLNRAGINNQDPELTNMADSMGVSHAGDLIFSIANSPELEQVGLTRIILMKNRYGSMTPGSFTVGLNKSKMSFYDADLPKDSNPVATPIQIGGMDAKLKQKLQFD
jgi:replicative DNA helicase